MKNKTAKLVIDLLSSTVAKIDELEKRMLSMENSNKINVVMIEEMKKELKESIGTVLFHSSVHYNTREEQFEYINPATNKTYISKDGKEWAEKK